MFNCGDVEKLRSTHAQGPDVLSLYLPVPQDPAELPGLVAKAKDLLASVKTSRADGVSVDEVSPADQDAVLDALARPGQEWPGHTVAFFACARLGLFEVLTLPGPAPASCMLATRPQVRPLLAALQRFPDYRVVIIDRHFSWIVSVSGSQVETLSRQYDEGVHRSGLGSWYGLDAQRAHQRAVQASRRHYRKVAAGLRSGADPGCEIPLVIGGRYQGVAHLMEELSPEVLATFAGGFTVDPGSLCLADIRDLAQPIIDKWVRRGELELTRGVLSDAPQSAAIGLSAALAAVNQGAAAHLLIGHGGTVPGFACGHCGTVNVRRSNDCDTGVSAVSDVLEEMVHRTLDDGGKVTMNDDAPFTVAAKLRFPLPA